MRTRIMAAAAFVAATVWAGTAAADPVYAPVPGRGTWETTLQPRDLDGNPLTIEAYYDTVLDITWLADANYAKTSAYDADGLMNWAAANAWAASLDLDSTSGADGWRLPDISPVNGVSFIHTLSYTGSTDVGQNITSTASEMAHLFYVTLGNYGSYDTSGALRSGEAWDEWGITNTGPFSNIMPNPTHGSPGSYVYWSRTDYGDYPWLFQFYDGDQGHSVHESVGQYAWAVKDRDFGTPVPLPAAAWLLGSGLIGLLGMARARRG